MLTLTAGGSVGDYSDTASLRQDVANSLVTIAVSPPPGSVLKFSTHHRHHRRSRLHHRCRGAQTSLFSTLNSAASASTALGVTI